MAVTVLHLQKQLLLLGFVALVTSLTDVNGFIDSTREIDEGIASLPTRQRLVAASKSAREGAGWSGAGVEEQEGEGGINKIRNIC